MLMQWSQAIMVLAKCTYERPSPLPPIIEGFSKHNATSTRTSKWCGQSHIWKYDAILTSSSTSLCVCMNLFKVFAKAKISFCKEISLHCKWKHCLAEENLREISILSFLCAHHQRVYSYSFLILIVTYSLPVLL